MCARQSRRRCQGAPHLPSALCWACLARAHTKTFAHFKTRAKQISARGLSKISGTSRDTATPKTRSPLGNVKLSFSRCSNTESTQFLASAISKFQHVACLSRQRHPKQKQSSLATRKSLPALPSVPPKLGSQTDDTKHKDFCRFKAFSRCSGTNTNE